MQNVDDNGGTLLNQQLSSDQQTVDYVVRNLRQSSRTHKVPESNGFGLIPGEVISSEECFKDSHGFHTAKRFIGQRPHKDSTEYLVQLRGEPAESAIWIPFSSLDSKAKEHVTQKPPPVVLNIE